MSLVTDDDKPAAKKPARRAYSDADQALVDKCNRRLSALDNERLSWFYHWRELAWFIQPRLGRFLETPNEGNRGSQKNKRIIDSTATTASQRFGAGMFAGTTSPARPWFQLRITGMDVEESSEVGLWLDEVSKRMFKILAASNFYRCMATLYEDIGVFGTSAALMYEDFEDVIRFYPKATGEYYLAVDDRLEVTTFAERIVMTVEQVVGRFGLENCSENVSQLFSANRLEQEILVGHIICPNDKRILGANGVDGMAYLDVAWEWGTSGTHLLSKKGFHDKPFIAPRWNVTGNDAYGRSCGMDALGDAKQLQVHQKRKGQLIDKLVNPPMVAPISLKNQPATSIPGGVTYLAGTEATAFFKPAYEVQPQGLPAMTAEVKDVQQRVKTVFFEDLFLMIAQLDTVRTAAEIYERKEEKMLMLGPALERIHDEGLRLVIYRLFGMMARAGLLPPNIPEEIQGKKLSIEFVSMLAQAQKAAATATVERVWALAGNISAVKPDVLDNLDADITIREYGDMLGAPKKMFVDAKKVVSIREARAKQQASLQQAQLMTGAAQTGKVLSETDVGGGQNALQKALGLAA